MAKTVAELLVELKLIDKRIAKAHQSALFVGVQSGNKIPQGYKDLEEFKAKIKSSAQSVADLIERRNLIKSTIVLSNARTQVTIAGKGMSVAEAIERKTSIQYQKTTLQVMVDQFGKTTKAINAANADVKQRLDQLLAISVAKDSKTADEDTKMLTKTFMETNEVTLVDPLEILKVIEKLQVEIDEFESNVDLALSASNAVTQTEL